MKDREHAVIVTSDLDVMRNAVSEHFYSHFVDQLDPAKPLATRIDVIHFGPITVGELSFGSDLRFRFGELGAYHVDVMLSGGLTWRQGRASDTLEATEAEAAVFQPVGDTVLERWPSDTRVLAVKVGRDAVEAQLSRMIDASVHGIVRLGRCLDMTGGPGRTWAGVVRTMAPDVADPTGLAHHPLFAERLQEIVISGLLLATDHNYREQLERLRQPTAAPRAVRRTMETIQAHPDEAYTLARLADIAGVGQRSLQKGFQRHVGVSPMAYVRKVRLGRAHDELAIADPAKTTVAEVATRWGFLHLGRFAGEYRRRYGGPPSETLRS